jgi:D-alanyl-D-alanine carboxypeptidase
MKQYEDFANLLINPNGSAPIYNCLLHINNEHKNINFKIASGQIADCKEEIFNNYRFRTGSITKTFTATIIFQLMEENLLSLEDNFFDLLQHNELKQIVSEILFFEGVNYSKKIKVKDLLQHKSGLRDYYSDDERFFAHIKKNPTQNWNWKIVLKKYFEYGLHKKGVSKPNELFYYSDTNYLLLAILIEEVTNKKYGQVVEENIIKPLSLHDTYLEFHQQKKGITPIIFPYHGTYSLKNVNTSFDWGGGGLISSTNDLHIFIRSLFTGKLFTNEKTLQKMINFDDCANDSTPKKRNIDYGFGIQRKKIGKYNYIGHNSAYGGMAFYNLETGTSFILTINQVLAPHKAEWLLKKSVEAFFPN